MIWCVEDDASIRDIEVYTLSSTGFDARGFADGVSFWSALQTEKPDLVVLDVMLPGVDGIELLQRMKASAELRTIPVVMATAKGAEYDKIRGLDLGADYYLVKPFGVMELVSCVKAVLRRCQPEKAAHQLRSGGLLRRDPHGRHAHPDAPAEARPLRTADRNGAQCWLPHGGNDMTKKIFQSILLVAGCVLLASLLIIMGFLYDYFGGVEENQLRDELSLAAAAVEDGGTDYLSRLTADRCRLTWIAADGSVLYDTKTNAESLENHASRAEVSQALATGTGESTRYSSTLMEKTMYYAQRLDDGTVLRISISRATVGMIAVGMIQPLLIVLIVALILSGLLARRLSRRIVDPLNSLDLEHPLDNDAYEELSPLLKRIHRQHVEIQMQLRELREKTDEFTQITGSMREGLVLLDEHGSILSISAAAQALFGADAQCVGRDFLTIERSHEISAAIQAAAADGHSEVRAERAGRVYQFDISRITSDGKFLGTVILAFDITEQEFAERNRREFTANVSHELKTPLQGIIGSAELIENGMVKPEDMPRFIGHIRTEAQRLVALIADIIRLSQLDEGVEMPKENVELLSLAGEVAEDLRPAADKRSLTISVDGQTAVVFGVRRLLYEMLYNLCDNAIKYNRPDGSVRIHVESRAQDAVVSVLDTGIGIAPEHQSRIFERFYRVDKSHSKASGGTGLGLSIVKHAAMYHGGKVELESQPGRGTEIRVTLPLPR